MGFPIEIIPEMCLLVFMRSNATKVSGFLGKMIWVSFLGLLGENWFSCAVDCLVNRTISPSPPEIAMAL